MTVINPLRKAMIVIAVSDYNGAWSNLPGTLNSAKRLADWARQPGDGRNYNVLEITDKDGSAVTVDRLRTEIPAFLGSQIIDRLVVYFAGHGLVASAAEQFLLLTNSANDVTEAIDLAAFKRGLTKQGIGNNHPDLIHGQLCLIIDACRNIDTASLDITGHPIITQGGQAKKLQIDTFFATMLGSVAYQPLGSDGQTPYCLYSDTLSDALEGQIATTIENHYHPFAPLITNQKLADYLDVEVPKRAAALNATMEPDNNPLIRRDHNYYDLLDPLSLPDIAPTLPPITIDRLSTSIHGTSPSSQGPLEMGQSGADTVPVDPKSGQYFKKFRLLIEHAEASIKKAESKGQYRVNFIIENADQIAVPAEISGSQLVATQIDNLTILRSDHGQSQLPAFTKQGDSWLLMPHIQSQIIVASDAFAGDLLINSYTANDFRPFPYWDTSLSRRAAMTELLPPRITDATKFADQVRHRKRVMPNNANIAAYLYDFIGDIDNIRRTAHYMVRNDYLPIDLAILAADQIKWTLDDAGYWKVTANIPAVEQDIDQSLSRPGFALRAFGRQENIPVIGILPHFRSGWINLADTETAIMPDDLRQLIIQLSSSLKGRSAVLIPDKEIKKLLSYFNYKFVTPEVQLKEEHNIQTESESAPAAAAAAPELSKE